MSEGYKYAWDGISTLNQLKLCILSHLIDVEPTAKSHSSGALTSRP